MLRKVCCAGVVLFVLAIGNRQQRNKPAPAAELSQAAAATLALYGVEAWSDASLGNHRARLRLPSSVERGGVAWAHIQWRLPGLPMLCPRSWAGLRMMAEAAPQSKSTLTR